MDFLMCLGFTTKRKFKCKQNHHHNVNDDHQPHESEIKMIRKYSWDEIERSTNNFSKLIGSGGFSNVYLGTDIQGQHQHQHGRPKFNLAIKIQNNISRVFKQELDVLLHLHNHNIVKLLGYCDDMEREVGALVFECVSNGSLQDKLHGNGNGSVIPWKNRMAIAFQVAEAIEYLHDKCALQIVHGDIKASNILLDDNLNCKLCDFGFAKMGFSSMVKVMPPNNRTMKMMGSPGYTDPHYLRTGIASKKNDVYCFGVLLLELVTGKEAFCSKTGQLLTSLVGPMLGDLETRKLVAAEMVDQRLALSGDFDVEEARALLSISALCLQQSAALRPCASQILQTIKTDISSISFLFESSSHKI
ncbi:hypothetical protein FNV43_RR02606 [Rhamnella rubrinervis]|uniref:non-specific serine/threonine protein kinase n=1 Tax=Rhamnella rubrinervis TaxID=2594499 RepID=A0A8K0HSF8_9ROSA|nr:hypothetical protein FNV43_RR02606 [Rhamnella rubrinervis]